jgi:hypothetical protein
MRTTTDPIASAVWPAESGAEAGGAGAGAAAAGAAADDARGCRSRASAADDDSAGPPASLNRSRGGVRPRNLIMVAVAMVVVVVS